MVSFWGERFRSYFINYCVPSLLSPNNIKLLNVDDGHKFLICTTNNDWQALQSHPNFQELSRHVELVLIQIDWPADSSEKIKFQHMNHSHLLLMSAVHTDRGLASHIMPDVMYTDGTVATILRYANQGMHAVLAHALRLAEEKLFPQLRQSGLLPDHPENSSYSINLPPRLVVEATVRSLYYDNLPHDWDSKNFTSFPSFCFWRLPGTDEVLIHMSYFAYLLIDFSAIRINDTSSFDQGWALENRWLSDNFTDFSKIKVIQDSDEAMVLSWTPSPDSIPKPRERLILKLPLISAVWKGYRLRVLWSIHNKENDFQKTHNLRHPIRLHSREFGTEWKVVENRSSRVMFFFFGDVFKEFNSLNNINPLRLLMPIWWAGFVFFVEWAPIIEVNKLRLKAQLSYRFFYFKQRFSLVAIICDRILKVLTGNKSALQWLGWRLRWIWARVVGRQFDEPRPPHDGDQFQE